MRALVTGAGGFLGGAVVRALAGRGDVVRALVRPRAGGTAEVRFPPRVEVFAGDVTDPAAVRRALDGCDVVFHLAGVRRGASPADFSRVNVGSTRILLEECIEIAPRLERFVLAGSLAAAGPSRTPRREDEPLAPVEPYGASKAEAERIALSFSDRLPIAIARPPRVVGPGDRENLVFFRIARSGFVLAFGDRPLSWIDVDDCARGFLLLADRAEATGQAFFLASPEITSAEGLMREVCRSLGTKGRRIPVPALPFRALAALADAASRVTGRKLPLSRKMAAQVLAPGWVCDPSKARERLGFEAATPLAASVARSLRWYVEHGWL